MSYPTVDDEPTAVVVRDLAFSAATAKPLELGQYYAFVTPGGVHKVDLTGDEHREHPRRAAGTFTTWTVDSFAHYWELHNGTASDIYTDLDQARITAVLDAHHRERPGWLRHRLVLELKKTPAWLAWTSRNGRLLKQDEFAEFLEDRAGDVASGGKVKSADLLEIAQHFHAHTAVNYKSGKRLDNGQTQLVYHEDTSASGGRNADIEIPNEFALAIVPFEDCEPALVRARFRYRLDGGSVYLGFRLDDPEGIERKAIREITEKTAAACGDATVMYGRPA